MANDPWRRVAFGLVIVLVLAIGAAVAIGVRPGAPSPSTSPGPTGIAANPTPTPSVSPVVGTPTAPTIGPSVSATPAESPPASESPSASGAAAAAMTIRQLKLDAQEDPEGRDRRLTFNTDHPAEVAVSVKTGSPRERVHACLILNGVELFCTTGTTFTMTGVTSQPNRTWVATLRGDGIATPAVDVALAFPTEAPAVTIDGAWFDGAARPDYNGVVVELVPRAGPLVAINAGWDGNHDYRLTIQPEGGTGLAFEGTGTSVAQEVLVAGGELQRIELANAGAGADHVTLTATITWQ